MTRPAIAGAAVPGETCPHGNSWGSGCADCGAGQVAAAVPVEDPAPPLVSTVAGLRSMLRAAGVVAVTTYGGPVPVDCFAPYGMKEDGRTRGVGFYLDPAEPDELLEWPTCWTCGAPYPRGLSAEEPGRCGCGAFRSRGVGLGGSSHGAPRPAAYILGRWRLVVPRYTSDQCDPGDPGVTMPELRAINEDDPPEDLYALLAALGPGESVDYDGGAGGITRWTRVRP